MILRGDAPCELPQVGMHRVIYHQVYWYTKKKRRPSIRREKCLAYEEKLVYEEKSYITKCTSK